ncbi:ABC transporter permease [Actinacidiphila sp. bgisy167]|uniref:ABC transporter permease n=1 Tax=Actinacidiphila sp. bgisy167 TaxID=3413797 RepID=UPI003D724A14
MTASRVRRQESWTWARLRAAPGGALALAALVLVTAFLAAALPRTVDAYEDAALHDMLRQASLPDRSVNATVEVQVPPGVDENPFPERDLAATENAFVHAVRPPLTLDASQGVHGVRNADPARASAPELPRPSRKYDPRMTLVAQPRLHEAARLVSGRLPGTAKRAGDVEAVLTADTAKRLGVRTGSTIQLPTTNGGLLTVRVTGIVAPRDAGAAFWNAEPDLRSPTLVTVPGSSRSDPEHYWHFSALISTDASAKVLELTGGALLYWHQPVDVTELAAHDVPALLDRLTSLTGGPDAQRLRDVTGTPGFTVAPDGLASLLAPFDRERAAASPLVLVATLGVGSVAGVVLLMAGGLMAARRRTEVQLLRVRGGGRAALALRLLGENALIVLPCAVAGTALALVLVPAGRSGMAIAAGAVVTMVATLASPVRTMALSGRFGLPEREDLAEARPSRRRTVAELTIAVIVIATVVALRRRGTAAGEADPFTAAAPVLVAVLAALVLLRLYPLPLRMLARPAARLRGPVLHLGLARAGRTSSSAALPLLALLVALAVTSFGGSVLAGVEAGRDHAAMRAVGADARIDSVNVLPAGLAERVRKVRGVRHITSVRVETGLSTVPAGTSYSLVIVDPVAYGELVSATGLGAPFPARALAGGDDGVLPAVVSPRLATEFRRADATVLAYAGATKVRAVAVQDETPAVSGGEFVIVSAPAMARAHADKPAALLDPTTLFATGPTLDGRGLSALARQKDAGLTVALRAQERARFGGSALQSGARDVYLAAVAGAAGYSVLALLLSLLHHAPQRKALLARLRTMGMTGPGRQWLAVLDMLPQVLLGAIGGILVSLATVSLLRPSVDLTALAFNSRATNADISGAVLRIDTASLLLPAAFLVLLACVVLAVQAWLTGRRGEATELRIGERS